MDDMGYGDIGPFNSDTKNRTPNLDRMAKEGMKLTSFYAAPVCTPSRAQILTGCYAKRVSLPQVIMPASPIGLNRDEHTIASLLKAQGYATLCVGKWHVGDQPDFLPVHYGFDHYFGLPYSNDMGGEWDGAEDTPTDKRKPPLPLVRDEKVIETLKPADQDRLTERYTEEAVQFIRDHKDSPFFLYLAHTAVHVPLHPGAKFKGKSANGAYGDWVEEADASLGRVLDTLRELHLEENTLVVFSSDNGPWLIQGKDGGTAGPLRGGKGGTYEGGVREPTIAWRPGHIAPEAPATRSPATSICCRRSSTWPAASCRTTTRSTERILCLSCSARRRSRRVRPTSTSTATVWRRCVPARGSWRWRRRRSRPASRSRRNPSRSGRSSTTSTTTSARRPTWPTSIPTW